MRHSVIAVVATLVTITAGSVIAAPSALAGGGGCHEPQSDAHGAAVDLKQFCMLPTVLRIEEGATVAWTNRDEAPHTVTGAAVRSGGAGAWGDFEQLSQGQTFTHTFDGAGVYPYYCMLHPGMIGAVVVGDGVAAGPYRPGGPASSSAGGAAGTADGSPGSNLRASELHSSDQSQQRPAVTRSSSIDGTFVAILAAFAAAIGAGVMLTYQRLRAYRRREFHLTR